MLPWVSPGNTGVHDRLVFWPGNIVHLVEFKARTIDKLRPRQRIVRERLNRVAREIQYLLNSRAAVDQYVEANRMAALSATCS